jgi:hypothetical protein
VPSGRLAVVIDRAAGAMVIDNELVAICDALSVTLTVNVEMPAAAGVPVMAPFAANDNPPGKMPDVTLHEYGGAPPFAVRVVQYATPTIPSAKVVVGLDSVAGATVIDNNLVAFCDEPSVRRTVNVELPAAAGVPLIAPFVASDNPAGKLPDATLHA